MGLGLDLFLGVWTFMEFRFFVERKGRICGLEMGLELPLLKGLFLVKGLGFEV